MFQGVSREASHQWVGGVQITVEIDVRASTVAQFFKPMVLLELFSTIMEYRTFASNIGLT